MGNTGMWLHPKSCSSCGQLIDYCAIEYSLQTTPVECRGCFGPWVSYGFFGFPYVTMYDLVKVRTYVRVIMKIISVGKRRRRRRICITSIMLLFCLIWTCILFGIAVYLLKFVKSTDWIHQEWNIFEV